MAQTISELEKERAKLLEAIENQASQISAKRGSSSNEARPHTLNDWLNAAEHVMPSNEKPKPTQNVQNSVRPKPPQSKPPVNTASNKASFFGVIIMLSLLLTIIGVVYIAFTTAQKDMQNLMAVHDETLQKLSSVEQELAELKKTVAEGGDSEAFAEVTSRLNQFEQEIDGLKHLQARVENQNQNTIDVAALDNVSRKLERQLNSRLEGLVQRLQTVGVSLDSEPTEQPATNEVEIQQPTAPSEPVAPKIEQKVVKLVEAKSTSDVDWLKQQKPEAYTLQLASMADVKSLQKMMADKNIQGGKIIPQKIDGKTSYVLVVGSHEQRTQANQSSIEIKNATGISPWIRRMRDISARLD
jgi:septal ring-binding cell division protein DamX